MGHTKPQDVFVCAWGGGVSLAEVTLARWMGCQAAMVASTPERLALLQQLGIIPIDRRGLDNIAFEEKLLDLVYTHTAGKGVSIFIDNIGAPVYKLTVKALARQGVIATSGWKHGAILPISRAMECINRHLYVPIMPVIPKALRPSPSRSNSSGCHPWLRMRRSTPGKKFPAWSKSMPPVDWPRTFPFFLSTREEQPVA